MLAAGEGDCDDEDAYEKEVIASSSEGSSPDYYGSRPGLTLGVGNSSHLPLDCEETSASSSSTLLSRAEPRAEPASAVASSVPASTAPGWLSGQVVGWPPIKTYRMNTMINHANPPPSIGEFGDVDAKSYGDYNAHNKVNNLRTGEGSYYAQRPCPRMSIYVKVNMDGVPIGRKINLSAHQCYQSLANSLDSMFSGSMTGVKSMRETRLSNLIDGSSGYVLTYEDKEGDWLLVGDVPWGFFLNSVKRLRIMRASDANGVGI